MRWCESMWFGRWRVLKSFKTFSALALDLIALAAIRVVTDSVGCRVVRPVFQALVKYACSRPIPAGGAGKGGEIEWSHIV